MGRIVLHNKKGMTLIEMLIGILLISIVGLALMQMTLLSISTNVQNATRDEAVRVAEERMEQLRQLRFNDTVIDGGLSATGGGLPIPDGTVARTIRNTTQTYTRTRAISDIGAGPGAKQITITVSWDYKGRTYTHGITTILKRSS